MQAFSMVLLNSFILLAFTLQNIENDWRYLAMNLSWISIAKSDKTVIEEVLPHTKLSKLVVILICVINQSQRYERIQIDSTLFPTDTEKLEEMGMWEIHKKCNYVFSLRLDRKTGIKCFYQLVAYLTA